jgi:hypothetical protein
VGERGGGRREKKEGERDGERDFFCGESESDNNNNNNNKTIRAWRRRKQNSNIHNPGERKQLRERNLFIRERPGERGEARRGEARRGVGNSNSLLKF